MDRLDTAFQKIYQSFNREGRKISSDEERHPEYTRQLLERLGNPDAAVRNILVTGSKGKGSTAYFAAQLIRRPGQTVGLFTSPHLLDSFERIRVNGQMIDEDVFVRAFDALEPHLGNVLSDLPDGHYIGPVGIFAVLAALYFRSRGVDWAIYETGRGALFDDVGQIQHGASAITRVLPEHLNELGPTVEKIAWHKAGVISRDTRVVVLGMSDPVLEEAVAHRTDSLGIAPEIVRVMDAVRVENEAISAWGTRFDLAFSDGRRWAGLDLPMIGPFAGNLATAVTLVERLAGKLDESDVREMMPALRWSGRGEVLSRSPYIVLDAAVRPESILDLLENLPPFDEAVLSIPDNKDRQGLTALLSQHIKRITLTTCSNPRLSYHLENQPPRTGVSVTANVEEALAAALHRTSPESRMLLLGTLSFVADVYRFFGRSVG